MSLIDDIVSAFDGKITEITIPESAKEWGWPEKLYALPFTMESRREVQHLLNNQETEAYLRIVIRHCCDEDGKRLFEDKDKFALRKRTPAWLMGVIGDQIVATTQTYEAAEKNDD